MFRPGSSAIVADDVRAASATVRALCGLGHIQHPSAAIHVSSLSGYGECKYSYCCKTNSFDHRGSLYLRVRSVSAFTK
jgi:hypothetical protein